MNTISATQIVNFFQPSGDEQRKAKAAAVAEATGSTTEKVLEEWAENLQHKMDKGNLLSDFAEALALKRHDVADALERTNPLMCRQFRKFWEQEKASALYPEHLVSCEYNGWDIRAKPDLLCQQNGLKTLIEYKTTLPKATPDNMLYMLSDVRNSGMMRASLQCWIGMWIIERYEDPIQQAKVVQVNENGWTSKPVKNYHSGYITSIIDYVIANSNGQ